MDEVLDVDGLQQRYDRITKILNDLGVFIDEYGVDYATYMLEVFLDNREKAEKIPNMYYLIFKRLYNDAFNFGYRVDDDNSKVDLCHVLDLILAQYGGNITKVISRFSQPTNTLNIHVIGNTTELYKEYTLVFPVVSSDIGDVIRDINSTFSTKRYSTNIMK